MKLITMDDTFILFLNRLYIQTLDFSNKVLIEKYLKHLLFKIKNRYDIEFNGYYDVTIYVDINYGVIIEVKKEELEYLDYFNNQIEMNTKVIEDSFLYEMYETNKQIIKKFTIYKVHDKIYLRAKENLTNIEMGVLLEISKIIYGKEAEKVIRYGKVLR